MKNKIKSYSFWMSVSAAAMLVVNNIGKHFGFYLDNEIVAEIVDSICGVLILFGVLTMTNDDNKSSEEQVENLTSDENPKDEKVLIDKQIEIDDKKDNSKKNDK